MQLPEFFGIDIGNHSIRLAQISRRGDEITLSNLAEAKIEFNLLNNASDQGMQELAEKLKNLRIEAGIRTLNCVMGIAENPVFSRLVTIPELPDDQIEEAVQWELKPLIPVPLTDVDIAFLEISRRQIGPQKLIDVFVVAAPKSLTDRYKQLAELAGFNLIALETEALANTRLVLYLHPDEANDVMIFDFGASGTDIVVARAGVPVFTQSLSTGSDALTKAIAADYGIDLDQAERYKLAYGLDASQGDGKIAASLNPVMQILLNELQRTLAYFRDKLPDSKVEKIYLCGQASRLVGLSAYLKQNLGLEPIILYPEQKISIQSINQALLANTGLSGYTVCLGLALKDR